MSYSKKTPGEIWLETRTMPESIYYYKEDRVVATLSMYDHKVTFVGSPDLTPIRVDLELLKFIVGEEQ